MVDIRVGDCKQCGDISDTIEKLDLKIAKVVGNMYSSLTLYSEKRYSSREIKTLIRYRNILGNLYYNGEYYEGIDYRNILSRVKSII